MDGNMPAPAPQFYCRKNLKRGWYCKRWMLHPGPCALAARWWNLPGRWLTRP